MQYLHNSYEQSKESDSKVTVLLASSLQIIPVGFTLLGVCSGIAGATAVNARVQ